jgi:flagellar biogenesis protein FliO
MRTHLRLKCAKWIVTAFSLSGIASAFGQTLGQGDEVGISIWRVLASLLLILVIGAGALLVVRMRTGQLKLWQPAANRRLQICEISRITPQSALCLVTFDDHEYLIALTSGGATLIEKRQKAADLI